MASTTLSMNCDQSVKEFFAPLVQNQAIETPAYKIDDGYLNMFKLRPFVRLDAYGMPVSSVFGYTDEPLLFKRMEGSHSADVYGVTVKESIANVQAQLTAVGATSAKTLRIDRNTTAIACKGATL